ncbi:lipase family protein [Gordonia sp. (in: high G+C Gram-positive bacteria)]|uniref:lipase family protein n=1 Tax=Gordonia sp. (in: high G+C Gram-positive bacteria) TaxID=84139 RepID=UPI003C77DDA5
MPPYRVRRALLAAASFLIGIVLILRPFDSLTWFAVTLGLALILGGVIEIIRDRDQHSTFSTACGYIMIACGMIEAIWPGLTSFGISAATTAGLATFAVSRLVDGVRGTGSPRVADGLIGIAALALSYVAYATPGVSIFAVALAIGIALIWYAVATAVSVFSRSPLLSPTPVPRIAAALLAVVVAVPLAAVSFQTRQGTPVADSFYEGAAEGPPGTLLRVEPFNREIGKGSKAWRILYTTRRGDHPALASGIVVAPSGEPGTAHPVIAWAHGTTGTAAGCAPSLLEKPFTAGAMPALSRAINEGWAVVAPDYIGLGTQGPHPYLIGQDEARSTFDAVRAARSVDGLSLANETVVWGYSQGGHAALWTDLTAPSYAPDVPLSGVAALAPASDLRAIAHNLPSTRGTAAFGAYLLDAYSHVYPDVDPDRYLRLQARLPMEALQDKCRTAPGFATALTQSIAVGTNPYSQDLDTGPRGRRLAENTPVGTSTTPLLILQGGDDQFIAERAQTGYVNQLRAVGTPVDYRTYPGIDHPAMVASDSPAITPLIDWTRDRLK